MADTPKIIDGLYWNDDNALYCEGHVAPDAFIAAVDAGYNLRTEYAKYVKHYWIRKVPDNTGEFSTRWVVVGGPGRGVKAYTILEGAPRPASRDGGAKGDNEGGPRE